MARGDHAGRPYTALVEPMTEASLFVVVWAVLTVDGGVSPLRFKNTTASPIHFLCYQKLDQLSMIQPNEVSSELVWGWP